MPFAGDEHAVGALPADGAHPTFGEGVSAGSLRRRLDDLDARADEQDQFTVDGESAWGAVIGFPRFRFPRPLSEPGVRLSPHRALHGIMSLV